ncbi:MAG: flagellar hook-length control protein FliK [Lachnospiraceae bacterium]
MVTGNIKTQAYQNPVTAAGNTQKISTKTDFSQSIRQAAGSYAGTDNKSQNVSRNQEAAKDSSTAKNAVKSEMTDRDAKSSDVRSTKTETAAVDKNSEKEETNPEIAAVDKNSEKEEINLEIAAVLAGTQLQNTAVDVDETVVSDFLQDIAQQLEVSVDDLMQSMQKLNLQVTDLQDPQNVLKLMTDVKDLSGTAEILTSPGLMETFKEINSQAKDFAQQQIQTADITETVEVDNVNVQEVQQISATDDMSSDAHSRKSDQQDPQNDITDLGNKNAQTGMSNLRGLTERIEELVADRTDVETAENITKQVVNQVKLTMKNDVTSLQMQLYPEHLGKVSIQVVSKNGVLTAQIAAENEVAKAALESQLATLKESFDSQGIKVQSVEVMVSTNAFEQNQQSNTENSDQERRHGRQTKKNILTGLTGEDDSELPEDNSLQETLGNTVSYTA